MAKRKTYDIGGTTYELMPPVFGVMRRIALFLRDAGEASTTDDLYDNMGERASEFVAELLVPEGIHPADRDMGAIAKDLEWGDQEGIGAEVLDDFFTQPGAGPENLVKQVSVTKTLAAMVATTRLQRELEAGAKALNSSGDTSPPSQEVAPSNRGTSSGPAVTET